jgi:uncharacterized protein with NRDE domain
MCTVVVALAVWPSAPFVFAANRDEMLERPAELPRLRAPGELADRAVLAPRDQVGGGTWLGLGDRELIVAITNRRSGSVDRGLRSRGEIVTLALGADDRSEARGRIERVDPRDFNAFHLLLADRFGAEVLWSDGRELTRVLLEPGIHWLTERSFGAAPSQRHERLAEFGRTLLAEPEPSIARWRSVLADHHPYAAPGQRPPDDRIGFDSMCVHALPIGYGTRSSTVVRLGRTADEVEFHHAPGRPCETDFVDLSADARRLLARPEGTSPGAESRSE